jgi:hypothetical protein
VLGLRVRTGLRVMIEMSELVERYVAVWNEPDAERRRARIREFWADGGVHVTKSLEVRGYAASAYERFVATGTYVFTSANNADGHHNSVRLNWQMVPAAGGPPVSVGFFILDDDGRIRCDYQFIEPTPRS